MQFKNWVSVVVSRALADAMLSGNTLPFKRENSTIKLGVIVPLTGNLAIYGQPIKNSIELAVGDYNAKGGILGKKIELVVYDSKADYTEEINAFEKLANIDKVDAVIGGIISTTALAITPLAEKYNLPLITPSASIPEITKGNKNVFRTSFITSYEGQGLAEFAYEKFNARKAAVMYNSSQLYSIRLAEAFITSFEDKGGKVVAYQEYTKETNDFNSILMKIKESNPDVLLISDYYDTVAHIIKQVKQSGIDFQLLGSQGWEGWETVNQEKDYYDGSYYSSNYAIDLTTPENKNFIEAYKKKYKEIPSSLAALGYDSIIMILDAMKKAGTTESGQLIEKLEKTNYQGVTGHITFDKDHNPIKPIYMFRIEAGKNILIQRLYPSQEKQK